MLRGTQMTRKFHTMSIEDREMFAYNSAYQKQQAEMKRILAQPEQRIKYAFEFLKGYVADGDQMMAAKCYNAIAKYSEMLDTSEAHF
jgi:soluble lytic murein transglycosylase-like protein